MDESEYRSGLDNFLAGRYPEDIIPESFGKAGIITNHTGLTSSLRQNVDLLMEDDRFSPVKIFSPEHGFRGSANAGEKVSGGRDDNTGLPVISLYGDERKPAPKDLEDLDTLIYDVQDVGLRYYTYISTMFNCLDAALKREMKFIVFDRFNPLGRNLSGNVLKKEFESFVGPAEIPQCYGLTPGELAEWWIKYSERKNIENKNGMSDLLKVVPLSGWQGERAAEMNIPWVPPSPNLPTPRTVNLYRATAVFEGTDISEGRGTTLPFQLLGSPRLQPDFILKKMRKVKRAGIDGLKFRAAHFTPRSGKHSGELCSGLQLFYREEFCRLDPLAAGLLVMAVFRACPGAEVKYIKNSNDQFFIDLLLGTDRLRKDIISGLVSCIKKDEIDSISEILRDLQSEWRKQRQEFSQQRKKCVRYSQ